MAHNGHIGHAPSPVGEDMEHALLAADRSGVETAPVNGSAGRQCRLTVADSGGFGAASGGCGIGQQVTVRTSSTRNQGKELSGERVFGSPR